MSMIGLLFSCLLLLGTTLPSPLPAPGETEILHINKEIAHPYYVSVTELEWNSKEKSIEISLKVFTDDFEEALGKQGVKGDLIRGDAAQNRARIESYIQKHLSVRVNGKSIPLKILGYENNQEATWSYFQGSCPEPPVKFEITNDCLYEIKDQQVNIIHLKSGEFRKSFRLVNPDQSIVWKVE